MVGWKSTPHVDAQVRFDEEQRTKQGPRLPVFNGDDQIKGTATFTLKRNYEDIRYRVVVRGKVETRTQEYPPGGMNSASSVETHTFLSAVLFDGSANPSSTPDSKFQTRLPFKFSLQNGSPVGAWSDSRVNSEIVQEILPTINSKAATKNWKDNFRPKFNSEFFITYTVIATAYAQRRLVASTSKDFSFLPTSCPPPPIPVEDFGDEYALRSSKSIKDSSESLRIGIISQEPSAVPLKVGGRSASTTVNLLVMLFRPHTGDFYAEQLPKQLRVKASLRSTTFVMPTKTRPDMHTIAAAARDKDASIKQEKSHVQNYTMALNKWETNESESEDDRSTISEDVFSTAVSFPLILEGEQLPCPTFYSPLLSRRYAVDLALTFDEQPGMNMKLRLPLQVFYQSNC